MTKQEHWDEYKREMAEAATSMQFFILGHCYNTYHEKLYNKHMKAARKHLAIVHRMKGAIVINA